MKASGQGRALRVRALAVSPAYCATIGALV
jgi:hypothetical protein